MKNETEKNWVRYVVNLCSKPTFALGGGLIFSDWPEILVATCIYTQEWDSRGIIKFQNGFALYDPKKGIKFHINSYRELKTSSLYVSQYAISAAVYYKI